MRHLPKAKARAAWAGQKGGLRKNPPNEKRLADYGIDKHLADRARKMAARRGNRVFNLGKARARQTHRPNQASQASTLRLVCSLGVV